MNTDIRISTSFLDHPKTKRVQREAGIEGVLCLLRLWSWCAKERPDGDLSGLDEMAIADAAGWPMEKDPAIFVNALRGRYLDGEPGAHTLHDWEEHNPYAATAEDRTEQARKAAHTRHHTNQNRWLRTCPFCVEDRETKDADPAASSAGAMQEHADSNAPKPKPLTAPVAEEPPCSPPVGGTRRRRASRAVSTHLQAGKADERTPDEILASRRSEWEYFAPRVKRLTDEHGPPKTPAEEAEWFNRYRISWPYWQELDEQFGKERRSA